MRGQVGFWNKENGKNGGSNLNTFGRKRDMRSDIGHKIKYQAGTQTTYKSKLLIDISTCTRKKLKTGRHLPSEPHSINRTGNA